MAVDLRSVSPARGRLVALLLSAANRRQFSFSEGSARGFRTLDPDTEVFCEVDAHHEPSAEAAIAWGALPLGIRWPVSRRTAILSAEGGRLASFQESSEVIHA